MISELTTIALMVLLAWQDLSNRKERRKLMEAIMAKDLRDLKEGEAVEKRKPMKESPSLGISVDLATEKEFDRAIKKELGREPLIDKVKERISKRGR